MSSREREHEQGADRLPSAKHAELLIQLFAGASVGLAVWDAAGRLELVNATFREMLLIDLPRDHNVLEQPIPNIDGMAERFRRAYAGEPVFIPTSWYDAHESNGSGQPKTQRVAISAILVPLFDATGALEHVVASFRNETDMMMAAERLRVSEDRFRLAERAARVGTFEWNVRTGLNVWTTELEAMHGLAPGEFGSTQKSWQDLVHPEDRAAAIGHVDRAFQTLQPVEGEWRVIWPDGSVHWLIGRFQVIADDDGAPVRLIGVNVDVTERKHAEMAIRESTAALLASEARKTAVMEAALDAIVMMDHEGRITDFNLAAEKMFGYSRDEVVGKPLAEMLIPASLRAQHVAGLKRYLTTGQVSVLGRRVELPAMRKDGIEFPAEVAIVRIRSAGPPIFTGYIRDITERRRAAESEMLRREKEAAEAANAELEAFSYSVAHDLRAPLRAITGYSTALQEDHADHLNQDAKHQLERIVAAGMRMGEIIDSLLSLARLTRTDLHRQAVDLVVLADSIVDQLRSTEPERRVDLATPGQLVVRGDPQLLRILLDNLLSNAWKFTRKQARPRIELGTTLVDERRAYFVRDNGAGFNMEYAAKLFIPFQRLHSPAQFEGTGIGLATVQRVVRRHGGRVWAEGSEGHGATFYFTLRQERFTRGRT